LATVQFLQPQRRRQTQTSPASGLIPAAAAQNEGSPSFIEIEEELVAAATVDPAGATSPPCRTASGTALPEAEDVVPQGPPVQSSPPPPPPPPAHSPPPPPAQEQNEPVAVSPLPLSNDPFPTKNDRAECGIVSSPDSSGVTSGTNSESIRNDSVPEVSSVANPPEPSSSEHSSRPEHSSPAAPYYGQFSVLTEETS